MNEVPAQLTATETPPEGAAAALTSRRTEALRQAVAAAETPEKKLQAQVALAEWLVVRGERFEAEAVWNVMLQEGAKSAVVRAAAPSLLARLGGRPTPPKDQDAPPPPASSSGASQGRTSVRAATRSRRLATSSLARKGVGLELPPAAEWNDPLRALEAGKPRLAARLAVARFLDDRGSTALDDVRAALEAQGHMRLAHELGRVAQGDRLAGAAFASAPAEGGRARPATPLMPAQHWRAAERAFAAYRKDPSISPGDDTVAALGRHLAASVVGHAGADAAVRLLETMVERGWAVPARDILQRALALEPQGQRRLMLAAKLVRLWEVAGDASEALRVADEALASAWGEEATELRATRARLVRAQRDRRRLAQVRLEDARMLAGDARLQALTEAADELEASDDKPTALATRIEALETFPASLALFEQVAEALAEQGNWAKLAELGQSSFDAITSTAGRTRLLRALAPGGRPTTHPRLAPLVGKLVAALAQEPREDETAALTEATVAGQGDLRRAAALLGWRAARTLEGPSKRAFIWQLAELRRQRLGQRADAERLYRGLAAGEGATAGNRGTKTNRTSPAESPEALHRLRELAAPTPQGKAAALADLAELRLSEGDPATALTLAEQALDRDPRCLPAIRVLEGVFERRGDAAELARRLALRALGVPVAQSSRLWFGVAWARERVRDIRGARDALNAAFEADPTFHEAWTQARRLAGEQGEWREVSRLLEKELASVRTGAPERLPLLLETADVLRTRLGDSERAHACLGEAAGLALGDRLALDKVVDACLAAGAWERAHEAVRRFVAEGGRLTDLGDRYLRIGQVAETSGDTERALSLYSQAYGHAPRARVVLEKLSQLCFERKDWDNALRATNELLEHHRAELPRSAVAAALVRVAWAEMHLGQRLAALARVREVLGGPVHGENAAREVADAWAATTFEPRLLRLLEPARRKRIDNLLSETLRLTEPATPNDAARSQALVAMAALAFVDRRIREGVRALDALAEDPRFDIEQRVRFLVGAGDLLLSELGRVGSDEASRRHTAAVARYGRARTLSPQHVLLADPRRSGNLPTP